MPADMVLIISYNRICEHTGRYVRITNMKSEYKDVTNIVEKRKHNYGLEMFRLW